jgi:hypothetical protein
MRRIAFLLLPLAACGKHDEHDGHEHEAEAHGHAHEPKHGGEILAVGDHELFLEVVHDDRKGELKLWVYTGEGMEDAKLDGAPLLNIAGPVGPLRVVGEPEGEAWIFRGPALKEEPKGARFRLTAGGKTYTPALTHEHR